MENQGKKTNTTYNDGEIQNIKMPKNLRQIGNTSTSSKIVYIEDYVMSYAKQLAEKENGGCTIAILLGYYIRTEANKNIFVKGAIEMERFDSSNSITLSDEGWTSVYENIKKYFLDVEIVGWALIGTEFFIESEDNLRKIHSGNFSGADKILMKVNALEKEENFYRFEQTSFVKQDGYYIYYERNEEMQNYMVDVGNQASEEVNYQDTTISRIRELISDKKPSKILKDKKENNAVVGDVEGKSFLERFNSREKIENKEGKDVTRLLYVASTLMLLVVLIIGGTLLENNKKMNSLENTLSIITANLNNKNQVVDEEDDTEVDATKVDATKVADGKTSSDETKIIDNNKEGKIEEDSMDVETISSGIVAGDNEGNNNGSIMNNVVDDIIKDAVNKEDVVVEPTQKPVVVEPTKKPVVAEPTKKPVAAKPTKKPEKVVKEDTKVTPEIKYYTVKEGESLAGIAYKLYNSANYIQTIKELNGIENEDKIFVGQKLIVP